MTREQLVEILSKYGQGVGSLNPGQVEWIMSLVDEYTQEEHARAYLEGHSDGWEDATVPKFE